MSKLLLTRVTWSRVMLWLMSSCPGAARLPAASGVEGEESTLYSDCGVGVHPNTALANDADSRRGVSYGVSDDLSGERGLSGYARRVTAVLIGYARCSTDKQDLEANRQILLEFGVSADQIYLD